MSPQRLPWLTAVTVAFSVVALAGQGGGGRGGQGPGGGGRLGGRGEPPPRDATTQTTIGSAAIGGRVVVEGSGAPVRRARVTLTGTELRGSRSTITDDEGNFLFGALPAGRFTMTASKTGYVDNTYGAKRAGRPGTQIQLTEGQKLSGANINLPRGGVITGVVVDEHGEPAAGTQVRALRYVVRTGERALQQAGQDTADDRGVYRIYQLQPGEYIVNALPRNMTAGDIRESLTSELSRLAQQFQAAGVNVPPALGAGAAAGNFGALTDALRGRFSEIQQQLAAAEQQQSVAYAPVFYPGTTVASSATSVTVGAGEERAGVDFRLQLVPTARVGGLVATMGDALPNGTQVALVPADRGGTPAIPGLTNSVTSVGPDGRFLFNNVTPGQYQLQARSTVREPPAGNTEAAGNGLGGGRGGQRAISQVLWAMTPVDVGGQSPPDTVLNLQPGMTVSGRVNFTGSGETVDASRVRVSISPRGAQMFEIGGGLAPVQADEAGRFSIVGVAPGRYTVSATLMAAGAGRGLGAGGRGQGGGLGRGAGPAPTTPTAPTAQWTLESATVDGRDILDFPVEIGPNQNISTLMLNFTNRRQELSGSIQDASGRPTSDFTIIVFPPDKSYWLPQARRIAATRPGTDGRFTFGSLPAGDYRLTAVTDIEPGEWYDPAFLTQLSAVSLPVTIGPGERKVQDIRLASQ